jgi:hypothetical protein
MIEGYFFLRYIASITDQVNYTNVARYMKKTPYAEAQGDLPYQRVTGWVLSYQ